MRKRMAVGATREEVEARERGRELIGTSIQKNALVGQTPRREGGRASHEGENGPPAGVVGGARTRREGTGTQR